jgi:DNA-binding NarL/FixJ family response regulator
METAKAVCLSIINMAWESNMTTDQKEQYVIQLYTEGKTFKVIAQLTHTSFRDISAITRDY